MAEPVTRLPDAVPLDGALMAAADEGAAEAAAAAVTGHTVVDTAMMEVERIVDLAGQLATVEAHWVMVATEVE